MSFCNKLRQRWHWIMWGALLLAALGFAYGYSTGNYLVRIEASHGHIPAALAVIEGAPPSADNNVTIIEVQGRTPEKACRAATDRAEQVRAELQNLFRQRCGDLIYRRSQRLQSIDERLFEIGERIVGFRQSTPQVSFEPEKRASSLLWRGTENDVLRTSNELALCSAQIHALQKEIAAFSPALIAARDALAQALVRYTDENAKVKELSAAVALLEAKALAGATNENARSDVGSNPVVTPLLSRLAELKAQRNTLLARLEVERKSEMSPDIMPAAQAEFIRLESAFEALKRERFDIARRQEELLSIHSAINTAVRISKIPSLEGVSSTPKLIDGLRKAGIGTALGFLSALLIVFCVPRSFRRIRSKDELASIAGVPLLGALKDLRQMTSQEQERWGFETFTTLRAKLADERSDALVCGFTSSRHGEGRSTWINLLQKAAADQGYRVITISAGSPAHALEVSSSKMTSEGRLIPSIPQDPDQKQSLVPALPSATYSIWGAHGRSQWRQLVSEWSSTNQLVVLAELPPASTPEAILLAERFPNLVWLCGSSTMQETIAHIQLLRNVRANVVGCAFNTPPSTRRSSLGRIASLFSAAMLAVAAHCFAQDQAGSEINPSPKPTLSLSASDRVGKWQKDLTLGPSDVFDISLHDAPDTVRTAITIGPDGRINYLEARDLMATGLTVDQLREALENILSKYHRAPRVVINPVSYTSKRYYILGNVNQKGTFVLDRPTSIVEAIAKAKGFTTALQNRNLLVQADLSRSFLIRRSGADFTRVGVDFESLFLQGDLSQNVALEPGDYLFFPPLDLQEVYVLGEVQKPGVVPFTPKLTTLGAIVAAGGFTEKAWKNRVLIVRGSFQHPQTYILPVSDVLAAKSLDLVLQNRDIVYVHRKPWAKAEELVETAVLSFSRAFVVGWVGQHVGPFIKEPIVE